MIANDQARRRPSSAKPVATSPKAPPTVLVVEKEALTRTMLAQYLRDCGYRVFEAGGEREVRTILAEASVSVDVVLVDVQATGSDEGFGLSQWIRRERPRVKVVLASGLARSAEAAGELCGEGPQRSRPYQPSELERRIRVALVRDDE
jgi:DNA-binding response OmpR family regulator